MKTLFLVATLLFVIAAPMFAQECAQGPPPSDIFDIGDRKVRIPPPEGFSKIGFRHGQFLSIQIAAEPPQNEIFAVHLPTEQLSKCVTDIDRSPDFYTKVSVSRIGTNEDITPASFSALKSYIEREFSSMTDPGGKVMIAGQQYVSKNLTELLERTNKVKWDRPINLGVFENNDRVYSTLTLLSLSANRKPYRFLGTVSFVYVNMRLVYVYAYKSNPVDADMEMLREFTRKWTTSIVAANEELTAKGR